MQIGIDSFAAVVSNLETGVALSDSERLNNLIEEIELADRAGVDSFLVSLDAQRTAYAAQQQLVTTRLAQASNLVELYRRLGGGLN